MIVRGTSQTPGRAESAIVVVRCDSCGCDGRTGGTVIGAVGRAPADGWQVVQDREGLMVHLCPRCRSAPRSAA